MEDESYLVVSAKVTPEMMEFIDRQAARCFTNRSGVLRMALTKLWQKTEPDAPAVCAAPDRIKRKRPALVQ